MSSHAPGVQATGKAKGWSAPSETPTQLGDAITLHTQPGTDSGSGVLTGQTLGERYRIVRKIGAGGMGEVWEAKHIVINKAVAIKVLILDASITNGAEQAERLIREARVVASIQHQNVVDITDFGHTPLGAPYFVMELLQGSTLKDVTEQQGPMPWPRARDILIQLSDALAAAHRAGVVHRDVKPDNVFLIQRAGQEVAKIIDFGIAKTTLLGEEGATLTQTGMVCGTPAFMSPEQARGEKIDERTDIYSLGCLAYQMLAGRQPFVANSPAEALYQQLFVEPTPLRQFAPHLDIPNQLDAIVLTCMRKNRNLRFQSMEDIHRALLTVGTAAPAMAVPHEHIPVPPPEIQTRFSPTPDMSFSDSRADLPVSGPSRAGLVAAVIGLALLLGTGAGGAWYFLRSAAGGGGATEEAIEAPASEAASLEAAAEPTAEPAAEPAVALEPAEGSGEAGAPAVEPAAPVPLAEAGGLDRRKKGRPGVEEEAPPPIPIETPPVVPDQGGHAPLPAPPTPLPDADEPAPAPPPAPEPQPAPAPPPPEEKKKPPKKVDDLRDPWERAG